MTRRTVSKNMGCEFCPSCKKVWSDLSCCVLLLYLLSFMGPVLWLGAPCYHTTPTSSSSQELSPSINHSVSVSVKEAKPKAKAKPVPGSAESEWHRALAYLFDSAGQGTPSSTVTLLGLINQAHVIMHLTVLLYQCHNRIHRDNTHTLWRSSLKLLPL